MDNSADAPYAVTDIRSPPPSRARRRLVQSTLFPHTPLDDTGDKDEVKKKTTQRKMKATTTATPPKSRASNKVLFVFRCLIFGNCMFFCCDYMILFFGVFVLFVVVIVDCVTGSLTIICSSNC